MPYDVRTFRVFVSSTFDDFKVERDALQRQVFPDLQQLCAERGTRFQAIDLRWGISEEAARDQQTIALCLQEIERCRQLSPRPNFIALIGNRYGWRPLPHCIPTAQYQKILAVVDKNANALLNAWYIEDKNSIPPVFSLLSRLDVLNDPVKWAEIEERLRDAIETALGRLFSATELEIRAGVLNSGYEVDHAFAFIRRIDDLTQGSAAKGYLDFDRTGRPDLLARDQLDELEKRLRARLGQNVFEYTATWTGHTPAPISINHVNKLCDDVRACLSRVITQELDQLKHRENLVHELEVQEREVGSHALKCIGRSAELQSLLEWIDETDAGIGFIHGSWGSGKTVLVSRLAQKIAESRPDTAIIYRLLSASPSATVLRGLLESLERQIAQNIYDDEKMSSSLDGLVDRFREVLEQAACKRPLVLIIDGIDLLVDIDSARTFFWLPNIIPPGVKILLSFAGDDCLKILQQRFPNAHDLELGNLPLQSAYELIQTKLDHSQRKLQSAQRELVENCLAGNRLPIFVELIGEEVCGWHSFDPPEKLPGDIGSLVQSRLSRLEEGRRHGKVFVSRCLGYLRASKNGLSEDELIKVLSADTAVMSDFHARNPKAPDVSSLPVFIWSRLRSDLDRYLREFVSEGARLLSFRHRLVEEILKSGSYSDLTEFHSGLVRHFTAARNSNTGHGYHRALAELPYQQLKAREWNALESTLTDVRFLEDKMSAGLGFELLADFERLHGYDEATNPRLDSCRLLGRSLANIFDFVRNAPANLGPQLHLELQGIDPETVKDLLLRLEDGCANRVWLQRYKHRSNTLTWHEAQTAFDLIYIHFLHFSPDDRSLLYGDAGGCLVRWNWITGLRTVTSVPTNRREECWFRHGVLLGSSGFAFASAQAVWLMTVDDIWSGDLKRAAWCKVLQASEEESFECLVSDSASGNALLAVRREQSSYLWEIDGKSGTVLSRRRIPELAPQQSVNDIASAQDGRQRAICFISGHLVVNSGLTVRAHVGGALHCEFTPDGNQIVTCGVDGTLAAFDPSKGLLYRIELTSGAADCLACAPASQVFAVGHRDGQVSLIDRDSHSSVRIFSPGVAGWILSLGFSNSGRYLAVGGRNGGIRVFALDKVPATGFARYFPQKDTVAATHIEDSGPCIFKDNEGYLFSTSDPTDSSQLPLKIITHCVNHSRREIVAFTHNCLRALNPETASIVYEQELPNVQRYAVSVSADGSTLALLEGEGITIMAWRPENLRWDVIRKLPIPSNDLIKEHNGWRSDLPLLLSRDGKWVCFPKESPAVGTQVKDALDFPNLERHLIVLDLTSGAQLLTIPYQGFCTALDEWIQENALVAGFGDGPIHFDDGIVWHHKDKGIRIYSLNDGRLLKSIETPELDLGITGVVIDPTQQIIASTSRGGIVRIDPLRHNNWAASIRLPSTALGPRFDKMGRILWVADNGRSNQHRPAEHYFIIRFICPTTLEETRC